MRIENTTTNTQTNLLNLFSLTSNFPSILKLQTIQSKKEMQQMYH